MSGAEVQGRCYTQLKELAEAELAQYTHREAHVPAVLIGDDGLLHHAPFLCLHQSRTHVAEVNVLRMSAYDNSEMERTQVGVRPVLYAALLCLNTRMTKGAQQHYEGYNLFHLYS